MRGKQTLEESLDLYVQGELMEGDNQYFCEEAGQKVDNASSAILGVTLPTCFAPVVVHCYFVTEQPHDILCCSNT